MVLEEINSFYFEYQDTQPEYDEEQDDETSEYSIEDEGNYSDMQEIEAQLPPPRYHNNNMVRQGNNMYLEPIMVEWVENYLLADNDEEITGNNINNLELDVSILAGQ